MPAAAINAAMAEAARWRVICMGMMDSENANAATGAAFGGCLAVAIT